MAKKLIFMAPIGAHSSDLLRIGPEALLVIFNRCLFWGKFEAELGVFGDAVEQ